MNDLRATDGSKKQEEEIFFFFFFIFATRGDAPLLFWGFESVIIRVCHRARRERFCFDSLFATEDRVAH